jgi:CRP-like cAMP-binding protein
LPTTSVCCPETLERRKGRCVNVVCNIKKPPNSLKMINTLINHIKADKENWKKFQKSFVEKEIPSKTVLLREGEISNNIFIIKKGCLREWFNKDGKDITFQFFFEGQPVASIDSLMNQKPSLFTIESIEPTTFFSIGKTEFDKLLMVYPEFKKGFQDFIFQRFRIYGQLFLSRIKDTPQERYEDLIKNNPEIIKRVPQYYIASFLGITPISLSRIRNRK